MRYFKKKIKENGQCKYNATLGRIRETIVTAEKQ
jgi:hypothetical protein